MLKKMDNKTFYIIAHNIRSSYNVGAIFRTADGMGAQKIYLTGYTSSPGNSKIYKSPAQKMIEKTALGAEKSVSWKKVRNISGLILDLKKKGFEIVALEQDEKSVNCKEFKPTFPMALIIGSEPRGINARILKKCDKIIEIPMYGSKNSLNVSVALGVAGYQLILD